MSTVLKQRKLAHTAKAMKKRFFILTMLLSALLLILPACASSASATDGGAGGSLKSITKPYIGEYECVEARLGETEFLDKYDYIKISLLDDEKIEISYKPKDGQKKSYTGAYTVNPDTRELTGELGILGIKFREKTKIVNGKFTLTTNILAAPLIMKFKMK